MHKGDGGYIKQINRSIIIKEIIEHGTISRASLSKNTGLNKSTVSSQVANLLKEDLIIETQPQGEHHTIGRKPIMLSINRNSGYVLGIDLDYNLIQYNISDLQGWPVQSVKVNIATHSYEYIIQLLAKHIQRFMDYYSTSTYGIVSVMLGVHGPVNKDESVLFVPEFQWRHKNLKGDLEKNLSIPISIENNNNLSSYAEKVYQYHKSNNLLAVNLSSGVGAGLLIDGKFYKGYNGNAGEVGHMIIYPDGYPCQCGNLGCWELYVSELSFFEQLSMKMNNNDITYEDVQKGISEQNAIVCNLMEQFIDNLSIGLVNLIRLCNPETIVLDSQLIKSNRFIIKKIRSKLITAVGGKCEVVISNFDNNACVMGACALAIQHYLKISNLSLTLPVETSQHLNTDRQIALL
ncbi:ROK family protein [Virgibacillus xinjiangensis]|uniref:ROK family protein n=1 Tax=Virgibacillus xinjiangensis TaxID=393090 RepID=A0ABV7CYW8_9BACI